MSQDLEKVIASCRFLFNKKSNILNIQNEYASRFIIQKIVSISKDLGMDFHYNFNIHIKGPYSQGLSRDYYENTERFATLETSYSLTPHEIDILQNMALNLWCKLENCEVNRQMELVECISTIIWLMKNRGMTDEDQLFKKVKDLKPHLSDAEIVIGLNRAKSLLFKPEYLTHELKKEIEMWDEFDQ